MSHLENQKLKHQKSLSIKAKIVLMNIGLVVLLGGVSVTMMNRLISLQEAQLAANFEGYVTTLGQSLSAQFSERYRDVQNFSIDPSLHSPDKTIRVKALNELVKLYGAYDLIMVVSPEGKLLAVNEETSDGKKLKTLGLYDKDFSNEVWFKAVMAKAFTVDKENAMDGTYFEDIKVDPYSSEAKGDRVVGSGFSAPLENENGDPIGVITTRASSLWIEAAFKETADLLRKQNLAGAELMLLDSTGVLLFDFSDNARGDSKKWLNTNLAKSGHEAAKLAISGKNGAIVQQDSTSGKEQFVGFLKINSSQFPKSVGWSVLVQDQFDHAFTKVNEAKMIFLGIFGFLILVAVGMAYWLSLVLSRQMLMVVAQLDKSGENVAKDAQEISKSSDLLSAESLKQAAAIQQTAASVEQVNAMVKKNSENAAQSKLKSKQSRDFSEEGQASVQSMIQVISEISESNARILNQVNDGNQKTSEIVKLISEIGNKTKVINDIVFQTKLLSFNASVEAARAGEHGKGFAVVAEEVGNLAQMSGNAAKEISELLEGSIQKVELIISETKSSVDRLVVDGNKKVDEGKARAQECGRILDKILESSHEVDTMINEIAGASQEQSVGVEEIHRAMEQLDSVTQQNSGAAQKSAELASDLSVQSRELKRSLESLGELITGKHGREWIREKEAIAVKQMDKRLIEASKDQRGSDRSESAKVIPLAQARGVKTKAKQKKSVLQESAFLQAAVSNSLGNLAISSQEEQVPSQKAATNIFSDVPKQDDPRFEEV